MNFPINLLGDLVAIQYDAEVASDVFLPDWQRCLVGTVVSVGPGMPMSDGALFPLQSKIGDRVSFGAAVGIEAFMTGFDNIRIMRDEDIDFVIETNKAI